MAAGDYPKLDTVPGVLRTTNDTPQTIVSYPMVDQHICQVRVNVSALNEANATAGKYEAVVQVTYRADPGEELGWNVQTTPAPLAEGYGANVSYEQSDGNVWNVRVTGGVGQNIRWCAVLEVIDYEGVVALPA